MDGSMPDLKEFLKRIISLPGLSGHEGPVREVIAEAWKPLVDEISVSRLGSLHALKHGQAAPPRPKILLAAHMDAIGLMVTRVTPEGFLYFTEVGGVDPRILPAQAVTVHARRDLPGVIGQPPDRLLPPHLRGKPVPMSHLVVDVGLPPEEVQALVRVGDLISFATEPLELGEDLIAGHTLDDRAAVAAVTACLDELKAVNHAWDVVAVATVQEEETLGGGLTSPFEIRPDIAVAIDVTFAKGPGVNDYRGRGLGKGVALGWGPNTHPAIFESFKELADQLDLPYEVEVHPRYSGTDAMGMQIVAEGIPTMVLSIPLRYMHTPVEVVSMKDVRRAGRLLAQFIAGLTPEFMEQLKWDE
ncbi:MAG TPA: M42 family peptidase [Anaerolinea thermolimosa]|uniref:M42 family peptidase n=2 Tax=Anaerolinea thermolimosa TaxID=229919 RepID=A0A3D1JF07_9CHLR|nr:M42 family peptidase [Anaerolinea thermolimosa]